MIQSVEVTNHVGETIALPMQRPEESGFYIRSINGLGPVKADINITEVLSIPGGLFNSVNIGTRNIVFDLGYYNWTSESVEEIRRKSYKFFRGGKNVTIKVITDGRTGIIDGYVESNEPNIFSSKSGGVISIICPQPYFYDGEVIQTLFSGVDPLFEFPWSNESTTLSLIQFGEILTTTEGTVFYDGEVETGVILHVNFIGAVVDPGFFNITQSQGMELSSAKIVAQLGSGFASGDELIISTIKSSKYIHLVRAGITYNVLNALEQGAKWFTLEFGDNVFFYTAFSGANNMQFRVEHRIYYEGM